ncbi:MAG: sensor histidine kinase [Bacteroidia bacterium]
MRYFLSSDTWLYGCLILASSYVFMQMAGKSDWGSYLSLIVDTSLFSIPVLVFVWLRESSRNLSQVRPYWLTWTGVFILYPVLCWLLGLKMKLMPMSGDWAWDSWGEGGREAIILMGVLWLCLEIALMLSKHSNLNKRASTWLSRLNPQLVFALIILGFCALLIPMSNAFQLLAERSTGLEVLGVYLSSWLQLFVIYFAYYFLYYFHHHFLFNRLLRLRGILYYFFGLLATLLIFSPLHAELVILFPVSTQLLLHPAALFGNVFDASLYSIPVSILVLSFPLIVVLEWYKQRELVASLEHEKAEAELSLLKQQINPHFFFNTLNNLYAMSLTQQKETPDTILQLSDLMRYVIYQGQESSVRLVDEIKYLQDYVDLQKIRLHKQLDLRFEIEIEDEEQMVSPLLFVILVENAFKHGVEPAGEASFLHLHLSSKSGQIHFRCLNSMEESDTLIPAGIGLENLRKRLSIMYPDRHELSVRQGQNEYEANLKLAL